MNLFARPGRHQARRTPQVRPAASAVRGRACGLRRQVSVLACSALFLAGCSSGGGTSTPPSPATTANSATTTGNAIIIKNFAFQPAALTVAPGTKVTVTNQDTTTHTVTAAGAKAFDTGDIGPGATATFTAPAAAGTFPYICNIHQYMHGTLNVS